MNGLQAGLRRPSVAGKSGYGREKGREALYNYADKEHRHRLVELCCPLFFELIANLDGFSLLCHAKDEAEEIQVD